jgi:hypothetical protein
MTIAVGYSIVRERGRRWLPLLLVIGAAVALVVGWGFETTMHDLYGM